MTQMDNEIAPSTYNISSFKGDVWIHREHEEKLISGKEYSISLGDILITAPMAEVTIDLSASHRIHLGGSYTEAFLFDSSIQDQVFDINEVAIDYSTLVDIADNSIVTALPHEVMLGSSFNLNEFILYDRDDDGSLSYQSTAANKSNLISSVELRDVISDFDPMNDRFIIKYPGSIAQSSSTFHDAQNKTSFSHQEIAMHRIDDHGNISFKDSQGHDILLTDKAMLNPVVHYLVHNFNGRVGDTLMFKVANDSYIYHFHPEAYAQQFGLIKFEGLAFDGLSQNFDGQLGNYLHIDFS